MKAVTRIDFYSSTSGEILSLYRYRMDHVVNYRITRELKRSYSYGHLHLSYKICQAVHLLTIEPSS